MLSENRIHNNSSSYGFLKLYVALRTNLFVAAWQRRVEAGEEGAGDTDGDVGHKGDDAEEDPGQDSGLIYIYIDIMYIILCIFIYVYPTWKR